MSQRRRLLLRSYSDEDEEEDGENSNHHQQRPQQEAEQQQLEDEVHFQDATNSTHQPNPNFPEPVQISDDEFIDVAEDLSPPSPPTEPASERPFEQPYPMVPPSSSESSGCPVGDCLLRMGLKLRREWLDSCIRGIESSLRGLDTMAKAKLCFDHFLISDMNYCGGGVLPPNVESMHLADLPGPFVLQVDEIVNISCPLKSRYQEVPSGLKRSLKLSMTDGVQRVFAMEYRPIKDLNVLAPAGLKVVICNVHIRHGLLLLVPEAIEVLGGMVEELEAARQRLVNEVNKPPRGKRSRTGVVPPLATRATLAAWPQNGVNVSGNSGNSADVLGQSNVSAVQGHSNGTVNIPGCVNASTLQNGNPQADDQGQVSVSGNSINSMDVLGPTNCPAVQGHGNGPVNIPRRPIASALLNTNLHADDHGVNLVEPGTHASQRTIEEFSVRTSIQNTVPSSGVVSDFEEMHIDAPPVSRETAVSNQCSNAVPEDVHMVDEFEHPLVLSGDQEIPYTYLASLSAKWAAMKEKAPFVQGKVKCFLTGVKGFQYKKRTKYELRVYVDDGSLISEILIDHNVVKEGIGHSPEEVTAALSSSDSKKVSEMKDTLRRFQMYLVNFEGTMLLEMSETSPLPVALKMNEGCPALDAWLLMRRLKSSASSQTPQNSFRDPIAISP